jgi:hypothetical protein
MAWAFFEAVSRGSSDASIEYGLHIVVETDIISLERSDHGSSRDPATLSATSVRTAYASIIIGDVDIITSLSGLSVNTDTPKHSVILPLDLRKTNATVEIEPSGRFVCRIPYPSHQEETTRNGQKRNLADLWENGSLSISCGFCCADIAKEGELQTARVLPTGIFDDVSCTRTHTQHTFFLNGIGNKVGCREQLIKYNFTTHTFYCVIFCIVLPPAAPSLLSVDDV